MRNALCLGALMLTASLSLSAQTLRIPVGSEIVVRTNDSIDAKHPSDSRIYNGVVERDVTDRSGNVVIPRGSEAELIMRDASDRDIVVDLESVVVNGQRLMVDTQAQSVTTAEGDRKEGVGANKRTGKYVGGGAVIGSIIGAIAGGGKGAAIGAATGAGAGAVGQTVTRGGSVRLPSESVLTFRLDRPLVVSSTHQDYMENGYRYHRYGGERSRTPDRNR